MEYRLSKRKKTAYFCPQCGRQSVVEIPDIDEDNAGWQHFCVSCRSGFMGCGEYNELRQDEMDALVKEFST